MRSLATALIVSLALTSPALATPDYPDPTHGNNRAYPVRVLLKLSRGITNIAFFWVEPLTNPIKEGWRVENAGGNTIGVVAGMATGVFTGTGYAAARLGFGAVDIASFVVPTPPIMNPETPFGFFETLGTDDAEHRIARVTPPHRVEPQPPQRLGIEHGL